MKDNSGKVLLALLAGASAGVIAGLLMAPDTGEATRGSVKKWAGKLSKDLEKNLQAGLDEIKNMSGSTLDDIKNMSSNAFGNADSGNTANKSTGSTSTNTAGTGSTGGNA